MYKIIFDKGYENIDKLDVLFVFKVKIYLLIF